MRRRAFGVTVLLAAGLLMTAGVPASAQRAEDYAVRLDAMAARAAAVRAALEAARETRSRAAARTSVPTDTVRSGPLRMLASRNVTSFAQAALNSAATDIERQYGAVLGVIGQSGSGILTFLPARDTVRPRITLGWTSPTGDFHLSRSPIDSVDVNSAVTEQLYRQLREHIPPLLERWVGAVPLDTGTTAEWATLRVRLASQTLPIARQCFEGVIDRCKEGFGLVALADSAVTDRQGARRLAVLRRRSIDDPISLEMERQCHRGVETACLALIRASPWLGAPLAELDFAREQLPASVIREAIRIGGPEAIARLVTAKGTVPERLVAISGTSIDSLMVSWHHHVRTARHQNDTMSFEIALTSVLWAVLFAVAALRSSRWR
jgi:hypothetical protein